MTRRWGREATLEILALVVCLAGLLGLIVEVLALKRNPGSVPRVVILALLAMICAPFYVAFLRRPQPLFLLPGVVVLFFLFPIAAPHGVVFYRDPIFNFHFSNVSAQTGLWSPGDFSAWARAYSYYPLGNIFLAVGIGATGAPPPEAFAWAEPLVRLLAIPAAVYAFARRFYSPRVAGIALVLYLGTASILFNQPVQQGIGTIFFTLSLLALGMLATTDDTGARRRLAIALMACTGAVILTHHLTSYVLLIWLVAMILLAFRRGDDARLRPSVLGLALNWYLLVLLIDVAFITTPVLIRQMVTAEDFLLVVFEPQARSGASLGHTFATWEIAWLGLSMVAPAYLAYRAVRAHRVSGTQPFLVVAGLVGVGMLVVTLPLIATAFNYVPLRISEFTNVVVAPLAAETLMRWAQAAKQGEVRILRRLVTRGRTVLAVVPVLAVVFIVMGGNLAPLSMRPYFEPAKARLADSPLHLGQDSLRAAGWAEDHLGRANVWGDQLVLSVFSGFANLPASGFGHYRVFENVTLNGTVWNLLRVGDYVVVERYMFVYLPDFLDTRLPKAPLDPAVGDKFATDPHFARVFQDATFSVYLVMSVP